MKWLLALLTFTFSQTYALQCGDVSTGQPVSASSWAKSGESTGYTIAAPQHVNDGLTSDDNYPYSVWHEHASDSNNDGEWWGVKLKQAVSSFSITITSRDCCTDHFNERLSIYASNTPQQNDFTTVEPTDRLINSGSRDWNDNTNTKECSNGNNGYNRVINLASADSETIICVFDQAYEYVYIREHNDDQSSTLGTENLHLAEVTIVAMEACNACDISTHQPVSASSWTKSSNGIVASPQHVNDGDTSEDWYPDFIWHEHASDSKNDGEWWGVKLKQAVSSFSVTITSRNCCTEHFNEQLSIYASNTPQKNDFTTSEPADRLINSGSRDWDDNNAVECANRIINLASADSETITCVFNQAYEYVYIREHYDDQDGHETTENLHLAEVTVLSMEACDTCDVSTHQPVTASSWNGGEDGIAAPQNANDGSVANTYPDYVWYDHAGTTEHEWWGVKLKQPVSEFDITIKMRNTGTYQMNNRLSVYVSNDPQLTEADYTIVEPTEKLENTNNAEGRNWDSNKPSEECSSHLTGLTDHATGTISCTFAQTYEYVYIREHNNGDTHGVNMHFAEVTVVSRDGDCCDDAWCDCSAGEEWDNGACTACAGGQYSTAGDVCTDCPAGFESTIGSDSCTLMSCNPGEELVGDSCDPCDDGEYNTDGVGECITWKQCNAGQYLIGADDTQDGTCTDCGVGYYQNENGKTTCKICSAGHYQNKGGRTSCKQCSAGHYQNEDGQPSCNICQNGWYSDYGQTECAEQPSCNAGKYLQGGTYNHAGTVLGVCTDCSAGKYSAAMTNTCTDCEDGTYSTAGQENCQPHTIISCNAGEYVVSGNATHDNTCMALPNAPCDTTFTTLVDTDDNGNDLCEENPYTDLTTWVEKLPTSISDEYETYQFGVDSNNGIYGIAGSGLGDLILPPAYQASTLGRDLGPVHPDEINSNSDAAFDSWLAISDFCETTSNCATSGLLFSSWNANTGLVDSNGVAYLATQSSAQSGKQLLGQMTVKKNEFHRVAAVLTYSGGNYYVEWRLRTCMDGQNEITDGHESNGQLCSMGALHCNVFDVCGVCNGDGTSCECDTGTFSANGLSVPNACTAHTTCTNGYAELTAGSTTQDRTCQYVGGYKPASINALKSQVNSCDPDWDTPICLDVNNWDVSKITEMRELFKDKAFNKDIGNWDVSSVQFMDDMFKSTTAFDQDISGWDVSNVKSMSGMFNSAVFNKDINGWDVSSVTDFAYMFSNAGSFNQNICWDINYDSSNYNSVIPYTAHMYSNSDCPEDSSLARDCSATRDICGVCGGDGTTCECDTGTFSANGHSLPNACDPWTQCANGYVELTAATTTQDRTCQYDNYKPTNNADLKTQADQCDGKWTLKTTAQTQQCSNILEHLRCNSVDTCTFEGNTCQACPDCPNATPICTDVANWDVSAITSMTDLFEGKTFNKDIGGWDVARVKHMDRMFKDSSFAQTLCGKWGSSGASTTDMFTNSQGQRCALNAWRNNIRVVGDKKLTRKAWRNNIKPTRDISKTKRGNMARLQVEDTDLSIKQTELMTKLKLTKANMKAIMTVATSQQDSSTDIADCHYDIEQEASDEKEILMPYAEGHYAFICAGDTFVARQQETAEGTNIACWDGSDWGSEVNTDTICSQTSVLVGSATTDCDATLPECCDACDVCDLDTTNDNSTCAGCDGVPNSGLVDDACSVCGGDGSSCAGCDGVPNSGLVDDACGVCGGDGSSCAGCTSAEDCNDHGTCTNGECVCNTGYTGNSHCAANTCATAEGATQYQQLGCCEC